MTTPKMEDVFAMSNFDPSKIAESVRDFAEKGAQQSRDAYAKMKAAGEDAGKTLEATVRQAQAGTVELGLKTIDALRTNADNSLAHMEALLGVKSIAEFFELQTTFFRKQAEWTMEQARTFQEASRQTTEAMAKPGKDATEKMMAPFKAA